MLYTQLYKLPIQIVNVSMPLGMGMLAIVQIKLQTNNAEWPRDEMKIVPYYMHFPCGVRDYKCLGITWGRMQFEH